MLAVPSLHPKSYYDEQIFAQEQADIFSEAWCFVGFKQSLSNANDFITLNIGNTPIVVQNIKDELFALLNICSHRKATIQTEPSGNRVLRCPYHCWSYGAKGKLISVAQERSDFQLDQSTRESLALKSFSLETAGDFIFVNLSKNAPSLQVYLGDYFEHLVSLSGTFTNEVKKGQYQWQTNWKIAVETVLEVYHVAGVHPESFAKLAKPTCEILTHQQHNTGNTPLLPTPKKWWAGVRKHLKLTQHEHFDEYSHFFIYPNLAIGITDGSLMSVQTYEPTNVGSCVLKYTLKMCKKIDGKPISSAVLSAVNENFTEFNHTTLEEDRVVAESCHKNMSHTEQPGVLGVCEGRLIHFHESWRKSLGISADNMIDINRSEI